MKNKKTLLNDPVYNDNGLLYLMDLEPLGTAGATDPILVTALFYYSSAAQPSNISVNATCISKTTDTITSISFDSNGNLNIELNSVNPPTNPNLKRLSTESFTFDPGSLTNIIVTIKKATKKVSKASHSVAVSSIHLSSY